jgi:hypothetical protein
MWSGTRARYLECGVLAHGFARVRCESCKDELLVAFSCKGRGMCPSCNAKRAHVTAVHRVEQVLPHVPHRQWTLSFPHRVRWVLRLLEKRGALPAQGPEDALQAYQAHSLQQRLRLPEVDVRPPPRKQPRCALLEGFSLHANTHLLRGDQSGWLQDPDGKPARELRSQNRPQGRACAPEVFGRGH